MPPLSPIPKAGDWPDEIAALARTEFKGRIEVVMPGTPGKYDPKTDTRTGGTDDVVVITGEDGGRLARIQHLRSLSEATGSGEWSSKRRYRFQIDLLPGDPIIEKAMVVRVRSCPRDPSLIEYAFQVINAGNSSQAALRTIEAVTDFGVMP